MYILYLDESGTSQEASYFVLAGLAVFEREIFWFSQELDNLQREYFPTAIESILFHATKLHVRDNDAVEEPWGSLGFEKRREINHRIFNIIRNRRGVLFGCAIERRLATARGEDPYERAYEDILSRFDMFLGRQNRQAIADGREEQRGLIVLAESSYQKTIGILARRLREQGTRLGVLHNVSYVPLFAPARDTRLLQFADFCSNALYGRYQHGLTRDFDAIAAKFDQDAGTMHGLAHITSDSSCSCLACFSRRARQPPLA